MQDREYHSAHVQMAWSQRFFKSEISINTGFSKDDLSEMVERNRYVLILILSWD